MGSMIPILLTKDNILDYGNDSVNNDAQTVPLCLQWLSSEH